MKSKTEWKLSGFFKIKFFWKEKENLKNINKKQLFFLHINGNYTDFTW